MEQWPRQDIENVANQSRPVTTIARNLRPLPADDWLTITDSLRDHSAPVPKKRCPHMTPALPRARPEHSPRSSSFRNQRFQSATQGHSQPARMLATLANLAPPVCGRWPVAHLWPESIHDLSCRCRVARKDTGRQVPTTRRCKHPERHRPKSLIGSGGGLVRFL
jgi:hypothetical protein